MLFDELPLFLESEVTVSGDFILSNSLVASLVEFTLPVYTKDKIMLDHLVISYFVRLFSL